MDPHSMRVLEYAVVRDRVVEQASNSLGQARAREMEPSSREAEVRRWQAETTEAVRLLDQPGSIPLGGIHNVGPALHAASIGGTLEPSVLLQVADTAAAGRKLKHYLLQRREAVPALAEVARNVGEFQILEGRIAEAIGENAEVRDEASAALARVRRELRVVRNRMMDRLHSVLRSPGYRDMLQDPVITTREGRYCIPVKSEYRVQFGGLVHDQSASGATVFMEPQAVVELGNELRQLEIRERQEVERILRELTGEVARFGVELAESLALLGELDFIFARGKLSQTMNGVEPAINSEGFIGLRKARHPLLSGPVVPIDVELGRAFTQLVITGPNTGGKTVSLKTVGLLCLMAQSGLHVPADDGATLPVFKGVYADIGDEQSIQQSLSTFSGHVTNIVRILKELEVTGTKSLVLLDELGAGTDPTEGGALARALLQTLYERRVRVIATTHYGELKEYAYATPGVENASVEFDMETLRPTYRLLIGVPGASNAFAISARLGLPAPVIETAQGLIGRDRAELSTVIQRLTENQRTSETDARRASQLAQEAERKREDAERSLRQMEADRRDILQRARDEAAETVRKARQEVERLREEIRRLEKQSRRAATEGADPEALQKMRDRLQRVSGRVNRAEERVPDRAEVAPEPADVAPNTDATPPAVGDLVWLSGLNQRGTVLAVVDGKLQVQVGSLRMTVPVENARRIVGSKTPAQKPRAVAAVSPAAGSATDARLRARTSISPEVDLRGMRADEALDRLDRYFDEACLAGLSPFRIVHGKGTGALKRAVWDYLNGQAQVLSRRHPDEEEGGAGVTVVELKE